MTTLSGIGVLPAGCAGASSGRAASAKSAAAK
jgi:hypothetical protein